MCLCVCVTQHWLDARCKPPQSHPASLRRCSCEPFTTSFFIFMRVPLDTTN